MQAKSIYPVLDVVMTMKNKKVLDMAKIIGKSYSNTLSKMKGNVKFSIKEASDISRHFNLPINFLFAEDDKYLEKIISIYSRDCEL